MGRRKKFEEGDILEMIAAHHGKIFQSELQKETGLPKSTLSEYINRLREKGNIRVSEVRQGRTRSNLILLMESKPPVLAESPPPESAPFEQPPAVESPALEEPGPPEVPVAEEPFLSPKAHVSYKLSILLFCTVLLSWTCILLLNPLAEEIAADFGTVTALQVNNLVALFLCLGGSLTFFWAGLGDRLSRRYPGLRKLLLMAAFIISATGHYLTALAQNYGQLLALQLLVTLGFSLITPLAISMALEHFPPDRIKWAFWLLAVAAILGIAFGFLIATVIVAPLPWRVPPIILGTLGLIMIGFIVNLDMPGHPSQDQVINMDLVPQPASDSTIDGENNPYEASKRLLLRSLLLGVMISIGLGTFIFFLMNFLLSISGFAISPVFLCLLAIYSSQLIYCLFRVGQNRPFLSKGLNYSRAH